VADNQYAALGLMLLGCLARLKRVVKALGRREKEDERSNEADDNVMGQDGLDLGEVVRREGIEGIGVGAQEGLQMDEEDSAGLKKAGKKKRTLATTETKKSTSKPAKKKRKKRDAFDDLFDRLD